MLLINRHFFNKFINQDTAPMKIKIALTSLLFSVVSLFQPTQIRAQTKPWDELQNDLETQCTVGEVATVQGLMCLVANILSVSLAFIGLAGFIMLIYGSLQWLISGGSSQSVENSKKTITFAFSGLLLALISVLIINTIAKFTGISVITEFFIPSSDRQW